MSASAGAYLASRVRFGMKFGLETSRALADALGHPELAYPTALIAGTNGKGSVVAYLDSALRASGLRVGRYTSPHLVKVHERIVVDGREIAPAALERAVERVRRAAQRLVVAGTIPAHPTYFEVLTLAAFEHFRQARVDFAVLEVGLGGRLDATNISEPLVSAIVSIDRDHEAYLGHTLAAIAREKAGVLRRGRPVVVGPLASAAARAIGREAHRIGARVLESRRGARLTLAREAAGHPDRSFEVVTRRGRYAPVEALPGAHQRDNALVAIRVLEELRAAGIPVRRHAVARALSRTAWPGRLQRLPGGLVLDGAHNPAGARALAAYLRPRRPFVLVFGAMSDKAVGAMARALFPLASEVILTRAPGRRAASPGQIASLSGSAGRRARLEPSLPRALKLARVLAPEGANVVVAGSLYLVGAVLALRSRSRK
jgi:dihydrofolate synthase/folylpolyglutamate synthase